MYSPVVHRGVVQHLARPEGVDHFGVAVVGGIDRIVEEDVMRRLRLGYHPL